MSRVLHRIYFNFDDKPDPFAVYLETWKRELPDFAIKQWDKNNLPLDLNDFTRYMTKTRNHAFLSDYFRCRLLREQGGIYLDADIEVLNGAKLRAVYDECQAAGDYSLFIGIESGRTGLLTPHSMGVKDNSDNPLLSFAESLYETAFAGPLKHLIKQFPMPLLFSLFFMDLEESGGSPLSRGGRFFQGEPLTVQGARVYPQDYFSPVISYNNSLVLASFTENTCLCHHAAATWKGKTPEAALFLDRVKSNSYVMSRALIARLEQTYGPLGLKESRPRWSLGEREIAALEKALNALIPYGGWIHRLLRKKTGREGGT